MACKLQVYINKVTPAQAAALSVGASIHDTRGNWDGTVYEQALLGTDSAGQPQGTLGIRWNRILPAAQCTSYFNYDDAVIDWFTSAAAVQLLSISPSSWPHTQATLVTVTGTGFLPTSVIRVDDISNLPTTYVNATTLTYSYPANGLVSPASHFAFIRTPGLADSNILPYTVTEQGKFFAPAVPWTVTPQNNGPITAGSEFGNLGAGKHLIGVYFYKHANDTATSHKVTVWQTPAFTQVSQVTSSGETASGWQYVALPAQIAFPINAGGGSGPFLRVGVYYSTAWYASVGPSVVPDTTVTPYSLSSVGVYAFGDAQPTNLVPGFYYMVDVKVD